MSGSIDTTIQTPDIPPTAYWMLCRAVTRAFLRENGALFGDLYGRTNHHTNAEDAEEGEGRGRGGDVRGKWAKELLKLHLRF